MRDRRQEEFEDEVEEYGVGALGMLVVVLCSIVIGGLGAALLMRILP